MAKTKILKKDKERTDYGLILGVIAVAVVAALIIFGPKLSELMDTVKKVLPGIGS